MTGLTTSRVAPFGHLGLNACVRLPRAFRSLPRPSSPPCAQASPTCPRSLDYNHSSSRARAIYFVRLFWANAARSTSELFSIERRREATARMRNCVTCVDSSIAARNGIGLARLTTVRACSLRGLVSHDHYFHPLSNSVMREPYRRPVARLIRRARVGISKIEFEIGVSRRATRERFSAVG